MAATDRLGAGDFREGAQTTGSTAVQGGLDPCLMCLNPCEGAQYWARLLCGMRHHARLMNPQFVKAYVKVFVVRHLLTSERATALVPVAVTTGMCRPSDFA